MNRKRGLAAGGSVVALILPGVIVFTSCYPEIWWSARSAMGRSDGEHQ